MKEFAIERIPVSSTFGVKNNEHLLMVYFIVVFRDAIYYDPDQDAILLFEQKENTLHDENIQPTLITETDDTLFVRPLFLDEGKHFRFPFTSHA
ncbi:hypothetical protein ACFCP7_01985 [Paenibacillus elgii]